MNKSNKEEKSNKKSNQKYNKNKKNKMTKSKNIMQQFYKKTKNSLKILLMSTLTKAI